MNNLFSEGYIHSNLPFMLHRRPISASLIRQIREVTPFQFSLVIHDVAIHPKLSIFTVPVKVLKQCRTQRVQICHNPPTHWLSMMW